MTQSVESHKPDTMSFFEVRVINSVLVIEQGPNMWAPIPAHEAFQIGVGLGRGWNPVHVNSLTN